MAAFTDEGAGPYVRLLPCMCGIFQLKMEITCMNHDIETSSCEQVKRFPLQITNMLATGII